MKVIYYISQSGKNPVREFINSLEMRQRAKIRRLLLTVEEYGLTPVVAHIKKLSGTSIWEIRILGQDSIRILYVTKHQEEIILLHGFQKKTNKTPPREISTALDRLNDLNWRLTNIS